MQKILVVEGNSPELVASSRAKGLRSAAEHYSDVLKSLEKTLSIEIVAPYSQSVDFSSEKLAEFSGAVFTGSAVHWSTADPEAHVQRQLMQQLFEASVPTFGSCNGLQLANVVLGGRSADSPMGMEIGLACDIRLTDAGADHALHATRTKSFSAPCVHRDQIGHLPTGAVVTAENPHSIQAMVFEQGSVRFWGVQYHPELALQQIADYLQSKEGLFAEQATALTKVNHAIQEPDTGVRALGGKAIDLVFDQRTCELRNWLDCLSSN